MRHVNEGADVLRSQPSSPCKLVPMPAFRATMTGPSGSSPAVALVNRSDVGMGAEGVLIHTGRGSSTSYDHPVGTLLLSSAHSECT
jgi:hypothetical protein